MEVFAVTPEVVIDMARDTNEREDVRKKLTNAHAEYRPFGVRKLGFFKPAKKRGLVVNISKQGLGMRLCEPIKPETELEVSVELPGAKETLQFRIRVEWIKEERKIGSVTYTHLISAKFTEFSPQAWRAVLKILGEE